MSKKILLIDDDSDFIDAQKAGFEKAGYKVVTAESEASGRRAFAESSPDLVIVDLMMEYKDAGFILSREFKKVKPLLPVILVTDVTRETGMVFDVATAEERSWIKADRILSKPVRFDQLQREVEGLLK